MKKNSTFKRFLAFLLCAAMIITYMPSSVYTLANVNEGGQEVSEEAAAPATETKVEEPSKDVETPKEETKEEAAPEKDEPAQAEPAKDPSSEEPAKAEEPSEEAGPADEQAVEPEQGAEDTLEPEEEPEEEEVKYPAQSFSETVGGVQVYVDAPENALPEGTTAKFAAVAASEVEDAVKAELGEDAEVVKAVDITFYDKDGNEISPKKRVAVKFVSKAFTKVEDASVVHIDDNGDANKVSGKYVDADGKNVEFEVKDFSIYAIVDEGTDARIKVIFKGLNGAEIDSMYVKKNDDMEVVLYDPGAGEDLPTGVYFRGWTTDQNYTKDTTALTIADVRTAVAGMLPPATDGTEVTYYAMLFKDYRITYLDEKNISLGQEEVTFRADSTSEEQSYKVNMGYTVQDDTHHFEGWNVVEGGTNIVGHTEGDKYENNDVITITGDVTFGVNAPKGHWFIFDENGKGATYNAPQFVYSSEKPTRPNDANMVRNGYTFGGWFADKSVADQTSGGTQYDFNQTLTDKTTVYARWIPKTSADYTIIIWKQNLAGDGYDFVEAVSLSGSVGSTINTVSATGTGNNRYATVNGSAKRYTGFHLKEYDQNVEIKTEGNSVLNIYYDRNEHTLQFQVEGYNYTATTSNDGTQYGLVNGEYVQLTRHNEGSWWNPSYYWTYGNGTRYNGTRYTRSSGWTTIKEITALYGQSIGDNFPIVGTNGRTYDQGERWMPQNSSTYSNVLVYIDIMPDEDVTFHLNEASHTTKNIYYYVEALPGETGETVVDCKTKFSHRQ